MTLLSASGRPGAPVKVRSMTGPVGSPVINGLGTAGVVEGNHPARPFPIRWFDILDFGEHP